MRVFVFVRAQISQYNYVSPRRGIRFVFAPVSDRSLSLSLSLSFQTFFLE